MKHFLMCEPKFYGVSYVINPWMAGNLGKVDRELADRQWRNLRGILADLATVSLVEPVAGLPDMVFTANAGLVHGGQFIASSFRHAERQPETEFFERFFSARGYQVRHLQHGEIFEGAGDALFEAQGKLWFGSGIRSEARALAGIIDALGIEACGLELVDPEWYHLDTAFCPLAGGYALAYAKAFSRASVEILDQAFGTNLIWVEQADARNFACNAVSVDRVVVMHQASASLKSLLAQCGFEVVEADVSEFLKAGGACKCLSLEI